MCQLACGMRLLEWRDDLLPLDSKHSCGKKYKEKKQKGF